MPAEKGYSGRRSAIPVQNVKGEIRMATYNPAAQFEVKEWDVEFRMSIATTSTPLRAAA